jgi:aminoglycoside 6'-N-acetyltransferase
LSTFLPEGVADHQHLLFTQYSPDKVAGIDLYLADENALSKGYGSLILTQFIEEYVKGQFETVVVDPKKDNIVAIQFFRKNGFICLPVDECSQHALMMLNMKGDE